MKILCFGDSNTYGYDPRSYLGDRYPANIRWVNRLALNTDWTIINGGQNGRCIPLSASGLPFADWCIVMLGTNDLLQGYSADQTAKRMEDFLKKVKLQCNNVLLIAPPIMKYGEWVLEERLLNESSKLGLLYYNLSKRLEVHFADAASWNIDISYDGVHFSEKGHLTFAEKLQVLFSEFSIDN